MDKQTGYILKRQHNFKLKVRDVVQELNNLLFEANVMQQAIQHAQIKSLNTFDSSVGDWKCQTRTAMIIDLLKDSMFLMHELHNELTIINNLIIYNQELHEKINQYNSVQLQQLTIELHDSSLYSYLEKHKLIYEPSKKLTLLSLCFLTTLKNIKSSLFEQHTISKDKFKGYITHAKQTLCLLSIDYEKKIAKKYCTPEEQMAVQQIETKNIQHMTSLFTSFRAIYKKMHAENQEFITHILYFCTCGGLKKINIETYTSVNNKFIKSSKSLDPQKPISVIEAYQFSGSLQNLQNLVGAINEIGIPQQYFKSCTCDTTTQEKNIESLDLALMAFFAQHPQFTNGANIDWHGLGLADSDLKKEYDYLLTLKGFSRENMSKLHIIHMFPSTVEQALKPIQIPDRTAENIAKHPHHLPTYLHCFHSDTGGKTMMQCNC